MIEKLKKKYNSLIEFNFAVCNTWSIESLISQNKKNYILSVDFIPATAIKNLKNLFEKYQQTEFNLYTQSGLDFWNLPNVNVFEYNIFGNTVLTELNQIKKFFNFNFLKKNKTFTVFCGSSCFERINFIEFLGYTKNLNNANYTVLDKQTTIYQSDSRKYEFLFGEKFENYQKNFKQKSYNYKSFSKYNHAKNFNLTSRLITQSYFYIGLENQPFTGKDNLSEKSLYGYATGIPTFNVTSYEVQCMLLKLGFKSTPLMEIEKNYNKQTCDEVLIEYAKDIAFLCNFTSEQWENYYIDNSETLYYNFYNLDNAEKIIHNNMNVVMDS